MTGPRDLDHRGVSWIGGLSSTWKAEPVKRHFDVQLGKMLQSQSSSPEDKSVPYLKALHVKWGRVSTEDPPEMWASPSDVRQYGIRSGDLLVCEGGEVGRAGIVDTSPPNCIIQNSLHRVRARDSADVRFLQYVLHAVGAADWFDVLCNRATIAHFTSEKLAQLRIPLPSLDEQRSIATRLNRETARIEALIEKKRRQLELLLEKRAALISHAVTKGLDPNAPMKDSGIAWQREVPAHWQIPPLYARFSVDLGKMLDEKRITGKHLLPYLRNVDVQWDVVNVTGLPEMDITPDEYPRYTLKEGDLLVCEGGEVGRTAMWRGELPVCAFQKAIHRIRPLGGRDLPRFFYYVMSATALTGVFVAHGNPNTIPHLTAEKLRVYRFAFPPMVEQRAIVDFLDSETAKIDALSRTIDLSIDLLREYRTALISAAVTGKIGTRHGAKG